jgi:biotin transporter BioY
MYIIAIGWIYVAFLMAITEVSIVAGVMTFVFYGFLPCALLLWILRSPQRKRNKNNNSETD